MPQSSSHSINTALFTCKNPSKYLVSNNKSDVNWLYKLVASLSTKFMYVSILLNNTEG